MAANPVPADMQDVIEVIVALTAQVLAVTTQVQNLAIAAGNNAITITTASAFAMTTSHLKVEHKVGLSL